MSLRRRYNQGVESKGATMTWTSGLVIDLVSTTCAACSGGYRFEINVKVNAADGVVDNNTLCGGGRGDAVKVTCNAGTTPFGSCATVPNTADLIAACSTGRAAYTSPSSPTDQEGSAACLQCSYMGVEGNCLAQLAALGVAAVVRFVLCARVLEKMRKTQKKNQKKNPTTYK